ncbi:type 1 glutamine amidotransferase domain-containing protein [Lacisediminihabitans sp.]|uniref:type 1 glutamine amidotransferase domain-containing protein n=1 Tax=Lacisediminihabitans sp. TaxID=2787631 RepID=UPI00374DC530
MPTVLFAITASPIWTMKDGSTIPAGFWAEEVVDPYDILTAAGITVRFATPHGAPAPLQSYSLDESMTGSAERSAELRAALAVLATDLAHPIALAEVDVDTIDAIYIPGGTGPMEDLFRDADLGRLLGRLQARNAFIAAACHGTIALLSARTASDAWTFAGYELTGYTNEEEALGGPGDAAPFTLENRLRAEGAGYVSGVPWTPFVVTDRNLISGQNPASAAEVARQLVASLA